MANTQTLCAAGQAKKKRKIVQTHNSGFRMWCGLYVWRAISHDASFVDVSWKTLQKPMYVRLHPLRVGALLTWWWRPSPSRCQCRYVFRAKLSKTRLHILKQESQMVSKIGDFKGLGNLIISLELFFFTFLLRSERRRISQLWSRTGAISCTLYSREWRPNLVYFLQNLAVFVTFCLSKTTN